MSEKENFLKVYKVSENMPAHGERIIILHILKNVEVIFPYLRFPEKYNKDYIEYREIAGRPEELPKHWLYIKVSDIADLYT